MKRMIYDFICNFVMLSTAMTILFTGDVSTPQLAVTVLVMGCVALEELRKQRKTENKEEA